MPERRRSLRRGGRCADAGAGPGSGLGRAGPPGKPLEPEGEWEGGGAE